MDKDYEEETTYVGFYIKKVYKVVKGSKYSCLKSDGQRKDRDTPNHVGAFLKIIERDRLNSGIYQFIHI